MSSMKLTPGGIFPTIKLSDLDGNVADIATPADGFDWRVVVVYRGQHCPMCTRYLERLQGMAEKFAEIGVDIAAVSADSAEQAAKQRDETKVTFPVFHGISIEQMQALGLYISDPRSAEETDHVFPEPGVFVVNRDGELQITTISNNPFVRPELPTLLSGLRWIRENNYPVRGKRDYA